MSEVKEKSLTSLDNGMDFVTVVSVGSEANNANNLQESIQRNLDDKSEYVTVLKIGQEETPQEIIEEVLVYRLPGERLGFGLKFEGGTKATEFVSRLCIQSCAPDSPASMVQCSWGKLCEGDEVLKIDSQPVTTMTRIDCVRCLKDSNVVIKLLIKHLMHKRCDDVTDGVSSGSRLSEDLPHVISVEKKRTPPPPPPVPPRKVPRKALKDPNIISTDNVTTVVDPDIGGSPNADQVTNGIRYNCFQSPRNSGKFLRKSPEVSRHLYKDRRLSDGSIGPPDAEVYLDLFSQEPGCNLSESDDTGSSISTIIDRLSSFPTTTNSSFAGSLPSTPTSTPKHLDVSNSSDSKDSDYIAKDKCWYSQLGLSQNSLEENDVSLNNNEHIIFERQKKINEIGQDDGNALQPPTNFQDAPLSYGNEDVAIPETYFIQRYGHPEMVLEVEDDNGNCIKDLNNMKNYEDIIVKKNRENMQNLDIPRDDKGDHFVYFNDFDLPRLVYFMPKLNSSTESKDFEDCKIECTTIESVKLFLENEIRTSVFAEDIDNDCFHLEQSADVYKPELYNLSWSMSSQLDTIGEDDEEESQDLASLQSSTPIVIVENADSEPIEVINKSALERTELPDGAGTTVKGRYFYRFL
ncbi:hypothetical protein FQA39_LY07223 [Lamprigera yunnana]|nr:hypothetical protein FQA39_LY07223 [Lamprigera yunnana]